MLCLEACLPIVVNVVQAHVLGTLHQTLHKKTGALFFCIASTGIW